MRILLTGQNLLTGDRPRGVQRCATQLADALGRADGVEADISLWFQADAGILYTLAAPYSSFLAESRTPAMPGAVKIALAPAALFMLAARDRWPRLAQAAKKLDFTGKLRRGYRQARAEWQAARSEDGGGWQALEQRHPSAAWRDMDHYDAVLSFEFAEEFWKQPLCLARRALKICVAHDVIFARMAQGADNWQYKGMDVFENVACRADGLLCNSEATRKDIASLLPRLRTPMAVAPLGLAASGPAHLAFGGARADGRARGRARDALSILMMGDMDRRKNLRGALEALPALARALPARKIILDVIGNTANAESMGAILEKARAKADVRFWGYLADREVGRFWDDADIFLFPSLWEGFGFPILEAYARGVPVVASEVSSMPEVGGDLGIYIDPCDPDSIAWGLLRAARMTPSEREAFAARAKARAAEFTWDGTAARCVEFVRQLSCAREP